MVHWGWYYYPQCLYTAHLKSSMLYFPCSGGISSFGSCTPNGYAIHIQRGETLGYTSAISHHNRNDPGRGHFL